MHLLIAWLQYNLVHTHELVYVVQLSKEPKNKYSKITSKDQTQSV